MQPMMMTEGMKMLTRMSQHESAYYKTSHAQKHTLQNINTKVQCVRVLKWMEAQVLMRGHEYCLILKMMRHFSDIFQSLSHNTNLLKCARWWKVHARIIQSFKTNKLSHLQRKPQAS